MCRRVLAALSAAAMLAFAAPAASETTNTGETFVQLNRLADVLERIQAGYVDEVSIEALIEAAINGMVTSLDPHSTYHGPDSLRDLQARTSGEFGGLGMEVTMEDGLVKVVSPIDDTPAAEAGIQPGDLISHIDGEPVQELNLSEAVERMRGEIGTEVTLTIQRDGGGASEITLTRAIIKVQSVQSRMEGEIGYLRVATFSERTADDLAAAIAALRPEGEGEIKGLVLDLRNNPGGLLEQAVKVADAFLDGGEIVATRTRRAERAESFTATPGALVPDVPIAVLINGGSASGAEIVAGALQDHRRAIILGTTSFGKGSVQTIMPLPGNGGALQLTTAHYYTPSGRSIQAEGIAPDIVVEQATVEPIDEPAAPREADLRRAAPPADDAAERPAPIDHPEDYQLSRALDLLRGLAHYSGRPPPP